MFIQIFNSKVDKFFICSFLELRKTKIAYGCDDNTLYAFDKDDIFDDFKKERHQNVIYDSKLEIECSNNNYDSVKNLLLNLQNEGKISDFELD
jgi:hypothetical protein